MKTIRTILVSFILLVVIATVLPSIVKAGTFDEYVSSYSLSAPVVTLTRVTNVSWTNQDIQLAVNVVSPSGAKIEYIVQPNGNVVSATSFNYTISSNGVYTFKAFDENGKVGYNTVSVKAIDRVNPEFTVEIPTDWVKENQIIDVKVNTLK